MYGHFLSLMIPGSYIDSPYREIQHLHCVPVDTGLVGDTCRITGYRVILCTCGYNVS